MEDASLPEVSTPIQNVVSPAPLKAGWKTSEFWLHILFSIATLGGMLSNVLPPKYGILAIAASQGAYSISRGITKGKTDGVAAGIMAALNPATPSQ